jgi:ADP-dependent NAD(P)H-hydrate dehydratase / NAD(P)H-hydrate epimerase
MAYEHIEELHLSQYVQYLPPRPLDSYKNDFGHVLVVGGDKGFSGAARMAAEAALRVGAGLVSVATHKENAVILNSTRPELMCHGIQSAEALKPLLSKATVIIVGPGLGQSRWAKALAAMVFKSKKPLVVDADALNLLAAQPKKKAHWVLTPQEQAHRVLTPQEQAHWILTPHPGEAARLLNMTTEAIQQDRLSAVTLLQKRWGGVAVLKGAGTLVAGPDAVPVICTAGNPGMATAGMGDILSGVIGGLAAQKVPLVAAAKLGVLIHALAGDHAAKEGERGMIASDLLPYLRFLVNI